MISVGGNIRVTIQKKTGNFTTNAIGEKVPEWEDALHLTGWLDLMGGSSGYTAYNAKIQESTHVFLCDYVPLPHGVEAEKARAVIGTKTYDIMMIDNPMELGEHMEIFLKYTGGQ